MRLPLVTEGVSQQLAERTRRADLGSGPIVIYGGSRGCTMETLSRITNIRNRTELNRLIDALMEIREQLIEEPEATRDA